MKEKARKTIRLSDEALEIVHREMDEREINSEAMAIDFILKEYGKQKPLAEEVADIINAKNEAWMQRVRWASQTAEFNSQILIDAVNTILNWQGLKYCAHIEHAKSPVIEQSERKLKDKIAHFKQNKDNKKKG